MGMSGGFNIFEEWWYTVFKVLLGHEYLEDLIQSLGDREL